jgi:manganese-dependent inorganic pyrophosphatase
MQSTENAVYVVGHRNPDTDSVCSAIAYAQLKNRLGAANVRPARAGEINAETAFVLQHFGVPVPELLTDAAGLELVLVDHNETGQALPHIDRAHVLEIWEHHRLGDLHLPEPIVIHCEPVGATATLIGEQFFVHDVVPDRAMAGILLASILSDTVGFRSPTTSEKDHVVAARLQPLAGIDIDGFAGELRRIRTAGVEHAGAADLIRQDFKAFRIGGLQMGIAQVEVANAAALAHRKPEVLREMRALRDALGLSEVVLMVTDLGAEGSDLWVTGDRRDVIEKAFGPVTDDAVYVPGCMSRKKQVVPRLEEALAGAEPEHSS